MSVELENALRRDLFDIAVHWRALLDLPRASLAHTTGTAEAQAPVSIGVLSLRRESGEQLAAWAHLVYEERDLHTGLDLMNVVLVCKFLSTHATWLSTHVAARDAADEIGAIAAKVVELVRQTTAHRFVVGQCPDCEGSLIAVMRPDDTPSDLRCTMNTEHTWSYDRWQWLGDRISGETTRREEAAKRAATIRLITAMTT